VLIPEIWVLSRGVIIRLLNPVPLFEIYTRQRPQFRQIRKGLGDVIRSGWRRLFPQPLAEFLPRINQLPYTSGGDAGLRRGRFASCGRPLSGQVALAEGETGGVIPPD